MSSEESESMNKISDINESEVVETSPCWADIDDELYALAPEEDDSHIYDKLVARQFEKYGPSKEPCDEAQELLKLWSIDLDVNVLPLWQAAVARAMEAPIAEEGVGVDGSAEEFINHAKIIGEEHPDMVELLGKNVTFMTGKLYDQGDRRNTQKGGWEKHEQPWSVLLTHPQSPLTNHPVGKSKQGDSIVIGETIDGERTANAVKSLGAIVIDIDSGPTIESVIDKLEELGDLALVYSSFNHKKTKLVLKHDDVVKKLKLEDTPNETQVREYLRVHHKDRYDQDFLDEVKVVDPRHHGPNGLQVICETPPLHKIRIILPLWEACVLADIGTTTQQWKDAWADIVTGYVVNRLGVAFDSTSCDVNRLFYLPRHPEGAEWVSTVVMGRPLRYDEIEPYSKDKYVKDRGENDPFTAGSTPADDLPKRCLTPSGKDIGKWYKTHKHRWLITDVLEAYAPEKIRNTVTEGKLEIECPFEHEHSTEGGTGTLAMSPFVNSHEVWSVSCPHDACQGRSKLEFVEQMLADGWFPEDVLWDEDFLIPSDDDEVIEMNSAAVDEAAKNALSKDSPDEEITQFLLPFLDADQSTTNRITKAVERQTALKIPDVKRMIKELREEKAREAMLDENKRRRAGKQPEYLPLEHATEETVLAAASAANWLPPGFVESDGWFCQMNYATEEITPICRSFEVVYSADGAKGQTRTNQLTIRYKHRSSRQGIVESTFRIGDTYKDSGTILGTLRNEGLDFAPGAPTEQILTLLRAISSDREAVYCAQGGWTEDRSAFISPTGKTVKKPDDGRMYVLDQVMRVSEATKGTVEKYRSASETVLRGKNAKLQVPGMLVGAVGCLADFLGVENAPIIANEGKKNSGKTTSLKMGISMFAIASVQGLMFSANSTEVAFEAMAMKASGAAMVPDDAGASKGTAEDQQRQIYQFANRMGRGRGTTTGGLQEINEWNGAMGLSTERGLLARLAAEDGDVKSGVQSRVFAVDFEGAEALDKTADADLLKAYNVLAHGAEPTETDGVYGIAWELFVRHLLEQRVDIIGARVSEYDSWWGQNTNGGERVVKTAALLAVASEVCQACGLWPENDIEVDWASQVDADAISTQFNVQALIAEALRDTLAQRSAVLDTEKQATENLRLEIIRAVGRGQIVDSSDCESAFGDILGYWITLSKASARAEPDLSERVYILPIDRLGKLGVKTDVRGLVTKLLEAEAVVLPKKKSKYHEKGLWETFPREGRVINLRVSGSWVHGHA